MLMLLIISTIVLGCTDPPDESKSIVIKNQISTTGEFVNADNLQSIMYDLRVLEYEDQLLTNNTILYQNLMPGKSVVVPISQNTTAIRLAFNNTESATYPANKFITKEAYRVTDRRLTIEVCEDQIVLYNLVNLNNLSYETSSNSLFTYKGISNGKSNDYDYRCTLES